MDTGKYANKKTVLKEIAGLIRNYPESVAAALRQSGVFIEIPLSKRELVDKVSYNLVNNIYFPNDIGVMLAYNELGFLKKGAQFSEAYSNLGGYGKVDVGSQVGKGGVTIGKATASGAKSGGIIGAIVGAIAGTITAAFNWGTASKRSKAEEEKYRQELIAGLFEEKKTNWTPILVVGGVLIVGGVVTFFALKE